MANYFSRLRDLTPTRVWVNNPTLEEVDLAIRAGAVGCTANPAYAGNLLGRAHYEVDPLVADVVEDIDDNERAAEEVQQRLVARLLPRFRPLFNASDGHAGLVSLQGSPLSDSSADAIYAAAEKGRALGPNCVPKIPATAAGLEAFAELVRQGQPTIVTEVFSLAQITATAERYLEATTRSGRRPVFIMAPITGIFGDQLRSAAEREGKAIDRSATDWAGVIFARAAARHMRERALPGVLLFGGARTTLDLTGLVGDAHEATINWRTFAEVIDLNPELRSTIWDDSPPEIVELLVERFADFRRACDPEGLAVDEFESFPPVLFFRDSFVAGWNRLHGAIAAERERRNVDVRLSV